MSETNFPKGLNQEITLVANSPFADAQAMQQLTKKI